MQTWIKRQISFGAKCFFLWCQIFFLNPSMLGYLWVGMFSFLSHVICNNQKNWKQPKCPSFRDWLNSGIFIEWVFFIDLEKCLKSIVKEAVAEHYVLYVLIRVPVYMNSHISIYVHTCVYMYVYVCVCTHMCLYIHRTFLKALNEMTGGVL